MKSLVNLGTIVWLAAVGLITSTAVAQPQTASGTSTPTDLQLSKIVLYASGVGYFQRDGQVEGAQRIALHLNIDNVNDLLKSLVVQDFDGGQVEAVTYDSRDPITKALKSFAIDLSTAPSLGQLLHQLRGEEIEVAMPNTVRGTVLSLEMKPERVSKDEVIEVEYVNLLTVDGVRSIPLNQVQHLQLTAPRLKAELQQALAVLATGHNRQKKTVILDFDGTGQRRVQVAYVTAAPVWKTSYRLVLSDTEPPFLQGWAIVENTTDEDWQNVQLSLVSGQPVSFVMDMYTPLYTERPVVVPELYTSLRPQAYSQSLDAIPKTDEGMRSERQVPRDALAEERARRLSRRRADLEGTSQGMMSKAVPSSPPGSVKLSQGVAAIAKAGKLGELFKYTITSRVSLGRQKSAMFPIVQQAVAGSKVSIYNEQVHAKHPLSGFRVENVTALYLMQGPVTVFDDGVYAGDARLADASPGQERLISYAMDLKTEVEPVGTAKPQELVSVSLRKGVLVATRRAMEEKTYRVRNRDQHNKVVLIEHPFRADWKLIEPNAATERTRDVYRFAVTVEPDKSEQLRVREEQPREETVRLTDARSDAMGYYLRANQVSPEVKVALQQVVALQAQLDKTRTQWQRLDKRVADITQEQQRIRKNMERLPRNADLYTRYVSKLDQQETEIEGLRQKLASLETTGDKQRLALQDYILGLNIQ